MLDTLTDAAGPLIARIPALARDDARALPALLARIAPLIGAAAAPDAGALAHFRDGARAIEQGHPDAALAAYAAALAACPGFAAAWSTLGLALRGIPGLNAEAEIACHTLAVRLDPRFAEGQYALAGASRRAGKTGPAIAACLAALALAPEHHRAWFLLGGLLRDANRPDEAAAAYEAAAAGPDAAAAQLELGNALRAAGRPEAALAAYEAACRLRPDYPEALSNGGCVLQELGRLEEAEARYRDALRVRPLYADARRNLGTVLHTVGRFDAAAECYRAAAQLDPDDAEAHDCLGTVLTDLGRLDEAETAFAAALARAPDSAATHFNRGLALLKAGRMVEGWAEHEWRWRGILPPHGIAQPTWQGEPLAGRRILIHPEQGLGDTIQFARYVPQVAARGGQVVLEVQPELARLMQGWPDAEQVIAAGTKRPPFDLHCSLMSLPHRLGLAEVPPPVAPRPDPEAVARWRDRLPGGRRIGLVWAGSPRPNEVRSHHADRRRSLRLTQLAPLAGVPDACWISLQLGAASRQAAEPPPGLMLHDPTAALADFADTATLVTALDLVVAVDTSVAHLAGTLGMPVCLLSRYDGCWRWGVDRDDSPWYPGLRLYRQDSPGDWNGAVARLAADLESRGLGPTAPAGPGQSPGLPRSPAPPPSSAA